MLHYKEGDLLKSDCTTILHQANCFSIMGGGIAKSIAEIYPEALEVDKNSSYNPHDKFGKFTGVTLDSGVTIVNLYGQHNLGRRETEFKTKDRVKMLRKALDSFLYSAKSGLAPNVNLEKVGVPYGIGCGLAGGDWNVVKNILQSESENHKVDIYVYKI